MGFFAEQTDAFLNKKQKIDEEIGRAETELAELNGKYEKMISAKFEEEVIGYLKELHQSSAILCEEVGCSVMDVNITLRDDLSLCDDLSLWGTKIRPLALSDTGIALYEEQVNRNEIEYVPTKERPILNFTVNILPKSVSAGKSYNPSSLARVIIAYDKDVKDYQHASVLNDSSNYSAVKIKETVINALDQAKEKIQAGYAQCLDKYLEKSQSELSARKERNTELKEKLDLER